MVYKDMNGDEIKEGMIIKHVEGSMWKIHANSSGDDLGVNASNKKYIENHPNTVALIYPLHQFNLSEWEIVDDGVNK